MAACLDDLGEKKNLLSLSGFEPWNIQPVASIHTDFAYPAVTSLNFLR
jgi:hypothetical protein